MKASYSKYQWQGTFVRVEFGYSEIYPNKEKPLWWSNYECSLVDDGVAIIPSVRVHYNKTSFVLANHFGIAIHKLENGGWPNMQHFGLQDDNFTATDKSFYNITRFNQAAYKHREQQRSKWMQINYPQQFEQMQALQKMIRSGK